jgi:hypothetical protein
MSEVPGGIALIAGEEADEGTSCEITEGKRDALFLPEDSHIDVSLAGQ